MFPVRPAEEGGEDTEAGQLQISAPGPLKEDGRGQGGWGGRRRPGRMEEAREDGEDGGD